MRQVRGVAVKKTIASKQQSCLYTGWVQHRRFRPREHKFRFPLYMVYLDLDEIETLFEESVWWSTRRFALARFRREDYHGDPAIPLATAVRETIAERSGHRVTGPIRMLTHLRYFGYCFNPVTFYYCYDAADTKVEAILAEVTNTPWKERHAYVLTPGQDIGDDHLRRYRLPKAFHVSPFMDMDHLYDWRFAEPGRELTVYFQNLKPVGNQDGQGTERFFDATLSLKRQPLTAKSLSRAGLRYPLMTLQVVAAIHWQALRLFLKRVPFYKHPKKMHRAQSSTAGANREKAENLS
ncbi:DUF1365 family protein [candidate division GN15 bacterium]|nr:DUF1365 family protein [candidate division GN15 bacterium]